MVTYERLRELLFYIEGILYWQIARSGVTNGSAAGYLNDAGYCDIGIDGKQYARSKLVWLYHTGKWPKDRIDHEDHNRTNDKIENLREATRQENACNQSLPSDNTSGVIGVEITNTSFYARLRYKGKKVLDRRFDNLEDAIAARRAAEAEYGFHPNHGK